MSCWVGCAGCPDCLPDPPILTKEQQEEQRVRYQAKVQKKRDRQTRKYLERKRKREMSNESNEQEEGEKQVITTGDVATVDAASLFGKPPAEGEADDIFSVEVPVDSGFRVQAGKQPLKLIDLSKGTSKANNPMWVWTFVVLLGKDAGRELKVFTALTAAAMWKLRETLAAFRIAGAEGGAAAKFKRSDVIGKYVMADITDAMYQGAPSSNVEKLYPVADADVERIKAAAAQALAASGKGLPPGF